MTRRVVIIGLDSVPPSLAFEKYEARMPCLSRLREAGVWGALRSTDPPITVPAWATITTGMDPGQLGLYGFRAREAGGYGMRIVTADDVRHPRLWDLAADRGLESVAVSVPPSWPPPRRRGVWATSCFMAPGAESGWAWPPDLAADVERRFGPYLVDAEGHRTGDRVGLVESCRSITSQHFAIFRHLIRRVDPSFAMIVDIGPDRLHHGLLGSLLGPGADRDPDGALARAGAEYYALLDREISETVDAAGPGALVMVVSDHGVQPLEGGICVNEWLSSRGYLAIEEAPDRPAPLSECEVDWARTRAWGEGGHYGRIFLNVVGREPRGAVPPGEAGPVRDEIARGLEEICGPDGEALETEVLRPERIHAEAAVGAPDLMVYWDALRLRSIGTLGHGSLHLEANDSGPDEANHSLFGILVAAGDGIERRGPLEGIAAADVFATASDALGLAAPEGAGGRSLLG